MATYVLRLIPPRADFAMTMTAEERAVMGRHAEHWQPWLGDGRVAVFGPVADETGSWGLLVAETDDEDALRAHASTDPAVADGGMRYEVGSLLAGFVRPA